MTKNELMDMAREADPLHEMFLERLANAILERAAVECDKQSDPWNSAGDFIACANAIRSLKITK